MDMYTCLCLFGCMLVNGCEGLLSLSAMYILYVLSLLFMLRSTCHVKFVPSCQIKTEIPCTK
jgi:hypothetical protein